MANDFLYLRLADEFEQCIKAGDFAADEKLPSIRKLHRQLGLSISTVYQAFIELEKRELLEARAKSGFFVRRAKGKPLGMPEMHRRPIQWSEVAINSLAASIVEAMSDPSFVQFGGADPGPELLPEKTIARAIRKEARDLTRGTLTYDQPQGALKLHREIAKRMAGSGGLVSADRIIVTNGCMEALLLSLLAVTHSGDTVAVESPSFHGFLQLMEDLGLKTLEIPSHPVEGMDVDCLEKALRSQNVKACVVVPNVNNPMGYVMPDQKKKRLVEMLAGRGIPIIEDGIYNDLHFGSNGLKTLKAFDSGGWVLYCSSFSKTLAPGLRMGWIYPGRFFERVKRLKVNTSVSGTGLAQRVVGECLRAGYYERHLRKMRRQLKVQMKRTAAAIAEAFPEGTKITQPEGGLLLWVQLHPDVDRYELYRRAVAERIAILPGVLCSSTDRFRNCIRICSGFPWSDEMERAIVSLGNMIRSFIR